MCVHPTEDVFDFNVRQTRVEKGKGITKVVTDKQIKQRYCDCLFKRELKYFHQQQIRSDKHILYTITQNKLSLSPLDAKRYIHSDIVQTLVIMHVLKHVLKHPQGVIRCLQVPLEALVERTIS
jgi:hypothetical protein